VLEAALEYLAFFWADSRFGTAMAVRIPMMATTMKSSIRVKPLRLRPSRFSIEVNCRFGFHVSNTSVHPYASKALKNVSLIAPGCQLESDNPFSCCEKYLSDK
jgi:hypothetical protein